MQFMTGLSRTGKKKQAEKESPEDPEMLVASEKKDDVLDLPEIEEVFDN